MKEHTNDGNESMIIRKALFPLVRCPWSASSNMAVAEDTPSTARLVSLPSELILQILNFLPADALSSFSRTCHLLHKHAMSDELWRALIQQYMPTLELKSPFPYDSYRKLYATHHPYWFLMKHRVWIGDFTYTGKLLVTIFDPRRGSIEGYQLVASNQVAHLQPIFMPDFRPQVALHRDRPLLHLNAKPPDQWSERSVGPYGLRHEIIMPSADNAQGVQYSTFMTAKALPDAAQHSSTALWPPALIPSTQRVRNASVGGYRDAGHIPTTLTSVCETAFRVRQWGQLTSLSRLTGVHMGETVTTYGAIPSKLYTPTAEKPLRGLWVGDYSSHGCEFILIHQPDDEDSLQNNALESKSSITKEQPQSPSSEAVPHVEPQTRDADLYRGKLEAIKLTGDPRVPRGEYTFKVDDLGQSEQFHLANQTPFIGAKVVPAQGQIAETHGFNDGNVTLHSQYWPTSNQISSSLH